MLEKSPISEIVLDDRKFFVKRDDLIDPFLAGNKYRKLYTLLNTPKKQLNKIISYGGTQSNAMLAIASMCQKKGWEFFYYTKPLSQNLKDQKLGNFFEAKKLGMTHVEIEHELYRDYIASLSINLDEKTFLIDQGGALQSATEGLRVLADEIKEQFPHAKSLATPSGTGTTALFLAINLPECKVYTTPCVGDSAYLKEQMSALAEIPENLTILEPSKKYHFAKPYKEFYEVYKKTLACGIEFDLLYGAGMWKALLEQTDEEILYVHSGGVSGNKSMLARYQAKGLIDESI